MSLLFPTKNVLSHSKICILNQRILVKSNYTSKRLHGLNVNSGKKSETIARKEVMLCIFL